MSREVISFTGAHYRLDPQDATIIQEQARFGARWKFFEQWPTPELAWAWLKQLGHVQPDEH